MKKYILLILISLFIMVQPIYGKINNFGKLDNLFYRGGQPSDPSDYKELADMGIKLVINLRDDPDIRERGYVNNNGMHYINIPMNDKRAPSRAQIALFYAAIASLNSEPFFVHCAGGRHRTGVVAAVYRIDIYGWHYDQVYDEMKRFGFYTRFGHGELRDFVREYEAFAKIKRLIEMERERSVPAPFVTKQSNINIPFGGYALTFIVLLNGFGELWRLPILRYASLVPKDIG